MSLDTSAECIDYLALDSLQIYFSASLELQQELISKGFYVPRDPQRKILMPIPLVYANFAGWISPRKPLTVERLIPPEWISYKPSDLGWSDTQVLGKRAFVLPQDEVYTRICILDNAIIFRFDIMRYHLERTSIRQVNPEKWVNWAMFYIGLETHLDKIIDKIEYYSPNVQRESMQILSKMKMFSEKQQGGKEVTLYAKVAILDFSFCLGCFDLVQRYLYYKALEHCRLGIKSLCNPGKIIHQLKLRIRYDPNTTSYAKVGLANIVGKRPQLMIKIASEDPQISIKGIVKDEVKGRARGRLEFCDHSFRNQYIVLNLLQFYSVLKYIKENKDQLLNSIKVKESRQ